MFFDSQLKKKMKKMKKRKFFIQRRTGKHARCEKSVCVEVRRFALFQVLHVHTLVQVLVYNHECYIYIHIYSIFFYFYLNEAKAQLQIGRAFVEQRDALAERIRWFFRQRQTEQTRSDGFFFHETPTARGDFIFFLFEMSQFD